jgi:hypothetical protein
MKKITIAENLYLTIKRQYAYSSIEDSGVQLVFERNDVGLKKLSSFDGTDYPAPFLIFHIRSELTVTVYRGFTVLVYQRYL